MTRSASAGDSSASRSPMRTRAACTSMPAASSRACEIEELRRCRARRLCPAHDWRASTRWSITISSPRRISRSSSAPTRSSAHVSEATTQSRSSRPSRGAHAARVAKGDQLPLESAHDGEAPSSLRIGIGEGVGKRSGSLSISAAITSVSAVVAGRCPSSPSSSRSSPRS